MSFRDAGNATAEFGGLGDSCWLDRALDRRRTRTAGSLHRRHECCRRAAWATGGRRGLSWPAANVRGLCTAQRLAGSAASRRRRREVEGRGECVLFPHSDGVNDARPRHRQISRDLQVVIAIDSQLSRCGLSGRRARRAADGPLAWSRRPRARPMIRDRLLPASLRRYSSFTR